MSMIIVLFLVIKLYLSTVISSSSTSLYPIAKPGCPHSCGNESIPYPFGITEKCSVNADFQVSCNNNSDGLQVLQMYKGSKGRITNISFETHDATILNTNFESKKCGDHDNSNSLTWGQNRLSLMFSSTMNRFIVIGCNSYGILGGYVNDSSSDYRLNGCMSICESESHVLDDICSGIGCCQVQIPEGLVKDIDIDAYTLDMAANVSSFNSCTYAFIAHNNFKFKKRYLANFSAQQVPVVVTWAYPKSNCTYPKNPLFPCGRNNTMREPVPLLVGFRCKCSPGYQGNPYLEGGGQTDIDECDNDHQGQNNCTPQQICKNAVGGHYCINKHRFPIFQTIIGILLGLLALLLGGSWIYWGLKKRKLIKLKEKFFKQNGGLLLEQKKTHGGSSAMVFTDDELSHATNNYHESRILGEGGYGTVYKGVLSNNEVVAIKKSKNIGFESQIGQFINEVNVLSEIKHRNVVQLHGCCLETEVPLLVYEFITNGTVFEHIHGKYESLSWEMRLKIATETAGAIAYLHSSASIPIIHRDIKTANILLDENFNAKVSDFGASRLVPLDQTQLTTLVQGTLGYLDPEYFHSSQLTEKSDVYSFGVVLAELITGQKALSFARPESDRNLAMYFASSIKEDRLIEIVDKRLVIEENVEHIKIVADVAKRCLRVRGEDRPTMKEVEIELEGLRKTSTHPQAHDAHHDLVSSTDPECSLGNSESNYCKDSEEFAMEIKTCDDGR